MELIMRFITDYMLHTMLHANDDSVYEDYANVRKSWVEYFNGSARDVNYWMLTNKDLDVLA